jgi:bacteriorhodopsin
VGQLSGLVPHLVDGGLSILQYADDTILFMVHDFEKAVNMKCFYVLLSSYLGSKLISTKVRFIALEKQKPKNINMHNSLVAEKGTTRLDI